MARANGSAARAQPATARSPKSLAQT